MPKLSEGDQVPNFTFDTPYESDIDFYKATEGKTSVVFFLRYYGCTVCQFEVHKLIADYPKFQKAGAEVFAVLQSEPETIKAELADKKPPFVIATDPRQKLYATFAIGSRDPTVERTEAHKAKVAEARAQGFAHGKYEGNEYQLPAVFIFGPDRTVRLAWYGQESSDVPEHDVLLKHLTK
jgi:peroxiredoxin